jgi:hypothetical protein
MAAFGGSSGNYASCSELSVIELTRPVRLIENVGILTYIIHHNFLTGNPHTKDIAY